MLQNILIATAVSIDVLSYGVALGIRQRKVSNKTMLLIILTCLVTVSLSFICGKTLYKYLELGNVVGALLLIGVGLCLVCDEFGLGELLGLGKKRVKRELGESLKAVIVGFQLSLDCVGVMLGCGISGSDAQLPVLAVAFHALFLCIGISVGNKIKPPLLSSAVSVASGFIILLIGFYRLTPVFC
jgi:putative Mn2+ efflux pump MntP